MKRRFWRKKTTPYRVGDKVRIDPLNVVRIIDIAPKGFWCSLGFIPFEHHTIEESYRSRVKTRSVWHNRIPLPGETFRIFDGSPRRATAVSYRPWDRQVDIWYGENLSRIPYASIDALTVLTKEKYIEETGEPLEGELLPVSTG